MNWLLALIVGGIAGWLADAIAGSSNGGLFFHIVLGILGAIVGAWLFGLLHIFAPESILGMIVMSTAGAIVILVIARLISGRA